MEEPFRPPRFDQVVDLEAHVRRLPPRACGKGMFFNDVIARVRRGAPSIDLAARAGIEPRRYVAFIEYPYEDYLRILFAAAEALYPNEPRGEGLRRIGHHVYDALLETHAGRVVFGVLGGRPDFVLMHGPRGYRIGINFGNVTAEREGPTSIRYRFRAMPALLETFQLGVIEGAIRHCGTTCQLMIARQDLANADVLIDWA